MLFQPWRDRGSYASLVFLHFVFILFSWALSLVNIPGFLWWIPIRVVLLQLQQICNNSLLVVLCACVRTIWPMTMAYAASLAESGLFYATLALQPPELVCACRRWWGVVRWP